MWKICVIRRMNSHKLLSVYVHGFPSCMSNPSTQAPIYTRKEEDLKQKEPANFLHRFCCLRRKDFSAAVCLPFFLPSTLSRFGSNRRICTKYPHFTPSCMIERRVVKNFMKNSKHLNRKLVGEPRERE